MLEWIRKNKFEVLLVLLILTVAAFLRFYKIDGYMNFLGDEGRDALLVKRFLTTGDIPLIGPPTSVGNVYLGPMYYYMMSVPMAIFWLNPVAAAGMVALVGVLTVGLLYFLTRKLFGLVPAVIAASLYTFSTVNIIYSKSSWNPNPAPFFALLALLGLVLARSSKNFYWFILTGLALGCAVQMHYLAFILLPVFGVLWINELVIYIKKGKDNFILGTVGAIVAFLVLMLPLVAFDFKHNFLNYRAITSLFNNSDAVGFGFNPFVTIPKVISIYTYSLVGRYLTAENVFLYKLVSVLLILPLFYGLIRWVLKRRGQWGYFVVGTYLLIGLIGISFYNSKIYDHYLGFLNPVPFIIFGSLASIKVFSKKFEIVIPVLVGILGVLLIYLNILKSPLGNPPNNQLKHTQDIANFIIAKTENKPFNFALISASNYDSAYQFYLDVYGHKPVPTYETITDQLMVVCEARVCDPTHDDKYEITSFGWSKVEWEETFRGVKIYKLVHNPEGKP